MRHLDAEAIAFRFKYLEDRAAALLIELNSAAAAVSERYKILDHLEQLTAESKFNERHKHKIAKNHALNGLGSALLIAMSSTIRDGFWGLNGSTEIGPKIQDAYWARLIVAGANFVRHGKEWERIGANFSKEGKGNFVLPDGGRSQRAFLEMLTELKKNQQRKSIECLIDGGLALSEFIMAAGENWHLATKLGLNDVPTTLQRYRSFLAASLRAGESGELKRDS